LQVPEVAGLSDHRGALFVQDVPAVPEAISSPSPSPPPSSSAPLHRPSISRKPAASAEGKANRERHVCVHTQIHTRTHTIRWWMSLHVKNHNNSNDDNRNDNDDDGDIY
jgi:hypothetical protein